jgi:hypothetical protein
VLLEQIEQSQLQLLAALRSRILCLLADTAAPSFVPVLLSKTVWNWLFDSSYALLLLLLLPAVPSFLQPSGVGAD